MAKSKKSKGIKKAANPAPSRDKVCRFRRERNRPPSTHADRSKSTPPPQQDYQPSLLGLPLEIRKQIYRPLLSAYWVNTLVPNPAYYSSKSESEPTGNIREPEPVEIGTPRCQNIFKQTMEYALAILSTCRQIHAEASSVFATENTWITVRVNTAGYGKAIKERGFGVVYCGDIDRLQNPVLKISVEFPSLQSRNEEDTFGISPLFLNQFPRALWTTKGLEEMVLTLELNAIFASRPQDEVNGLLSPFRQIRGLHTLILKGVKQKKYTRELPRSLKTPYKDSDEILQDLKLGLMAPMHAHEHGYCKEAADYVEATIAFLADCYKIYGAKFVSGNSNTHGKICETLINLAAGLTQLRLKEGRYDSAVKYATLAQTILPIADHSKLSLLLMRCEAYEALGQDVKLMRDLLEAQELEPESKLVMEELTKLKKRLDPDPMKALSAFKELRVSVAEEKEVEQQALVDAVLAGEVVIKNLSDGTTIIEDHR